MAFSIFAKLYKHIINFRTFSLSPKETLFPLSVTPILPFPQQPLIYSVSMVLPTLDISYFKKS